jgi:hypothetical protein
MSLRSVRAISKALSQIIKKEKRRFICVIVKWTCVYVRDVGIELIALSMKGSILPLSYIPSSNGLFSIFLSSPARILGYIWWYMDDKFSDLHHNKLRIQFYILLTFTWLGGAENTAFQIFLSKYLKKFFIICISL